MADVEVEVEVGSAIQYGWSRFERDLDEAPADRLEHVDLRGQPLVHGGERLEVGVSGVRTPASLLTWPNEDGVSMYRKLASTR